MSYLYSCCNKKNAKIKQKILFKKKVYYAFYVYDFSTMVLSMNLSSMQGFSYIKMSRSLKSLV